MLRNAELCLDHRKGRGQMTNQEIKTGFNQIIAAAQTAGNSDAIARLEIAREYFTNNEFKTAIQDYVWQINQNS